MEMPEVISEDARKPVRPRRTVVKKVTKKATKSIAVPQDQYEGSVPKPANKAVRATVNTSQWGRTSAVIPQKRAESPATQSYKAMLSELYSANDTWDSPIPDTFNDVLQSGIKHSTRQNRR